MYNEFASCYDALMQDVDYPAWAARCAALMGPGVKTVTECACGTGNITIPLAKMGYRMTGVDLSGEMLQHAMEKARKEGLMIPFVCQDMTRLQVTRRQDAILATCDGVNYLTDEAALKGFLTAAYQGLKPGGKLIFDVSSEYKLKNTLGNNTLTLDEEDAAYIWQNEWNENKRTVTMYLSIFVHDAGQETFRRIREDQTQRAWSREELTDALSACGYTGITFYGGLEDRAPAADDARLLVVAAKGE